MIAKTAEYKGKKVILFKSGDIGYCGQVFPNGLGCNLEILQALGLR